MLDLVFEDARIVDGTGNPWFRGGVGIRDGVITRVAPKVIEEARKRIDASGMVIAPGFIDVHAHSDFSLFYDPGVPYKLSQGITTEICGNCGLSAAPLRGSKLTRMQADIAGDMQTPLEWEGFEDYLRVVRSRPLGTNVGWLVGYNTIREYVAGVRPSMSWEENEEILNLVSRCMQAGALGLSSGLVYEPGNYTTTDELIAACRLVARWNGVYATHTRGLRETLVDGVEEAIEIGSRTGVPVQVSHLMPQYGGWDTVQAALDAIDDARARGIDITFDLHLDTVGGTSALAMLPPWLKEGGVDGMVARLNDPDSRAKVLAAIRSFLGPGTSGFLRHSRWDLLKVSSSPASPHLMGKSFKQIAEELGEAPWDVYLNVLVTNWDKLQLTGLYTPVEEIRRVLSHPMSMVATDAVPVRRDQRITTPRNYSTIPKLLGRYVRAEGLLSLEEAVQKVTSRPASRFGLKRRGIIAEGFWADIVLFDPDTVSPALTDDDVMNGVECECPYAQGIRYVVVNGVLEIEEGRVTGALAGRGLFREAE